MAMGKRKRDQPSSFWIATTALPQSGGHPFYQQVNKILDAEGFDAFVEACCRGFYADQKGRPSLPPAVYFRLLLIGYFEGLDSERGIAWRVADSLALRRFLGYGLADGTPDHSTISRNRRLIDVQTHQAVFTWVLQVLAKRKLLDGKTLGIDATTLEANAALRSIVRRDTGEDYKAFLEHLAEESGIETPTHLWVQPCQDLAKLDRKRPRKGSNEDWENPFDPDAKISKMKDEQAYQQLSEQVLREVVADKGYHSNEVLKRQRQREIRTYISEPDRGRRNWKDKPVERDAVCGNRRRIPGLRGKRLMRKRDELVERSFAHAYDTGGMRRTHLKRHRNILKRLLIHVAGFNLSLILRRLLGFGTACSLQGRVGCFVDGFIALWRHCTGGSARRRTLVMQDCWIRSGTRSAA